MNKSDIKDVLAELMERDGVNQSYLAENAKVTQPTISRILRGSHKTLELQTAQRLADFFRVTIDQLVGNEPLDSDKQWYQVKQMWQRLPDYKKKVAESTVKTLADTEERRKEDVGNVPERRFPYGAPNFPQKNNTCATPRRKTK